MSTFNPRESAEWALGADAEAGKLQDGVDKALADGAARGFPSPPGETLADILAAGQETKGKLTGVNGKIYDTRREVLFQQDEFALSVLVKLAKLAMELYREQIFNALALEQSQVEAQKETSRADVERLNAETELRQRAIIQNRAEAERQIIVYKQQLVDAETRTLTAETILIQAQLATAEKRLEIITSIYQVLAAEELVLAAERRRAASLSQVLEAELIVAGVKKEMIPAYIQKAEAREELAQAITQEIPITEALIRLGYDRLDLKTTEEYAGHLDREQKEELELLREQLIRANTALEMTRVQSRRQLTEYRNAVQAQIINKRKDLQMNEIDFKLTSSLARAIIGPEVEKAIASGEAGALLGEIGAIVSGITGRGQVQAKAILSGKETTIETNTTSELTRKISGD
jgi:hypothetical protein